MAAKVRDEREGRGEEGMGFSMDSGLCWGHRIVSRRSRRGWRNVLRSAVGKSGGELTRESRAFGDQITRSGFERSGNRVDIAIVGSTGSKIRVCASRLDQLGSVGTTGKVTCSKDGRREKGAVVKMIMISASLHFPLQARRRCAYQRACQGLKPGPAGV